MPERPCSKKGPICDVRKQKRTTSKTPRENTTKNKYLLEKGKQLKNADNGKTGAIRSGVARTPRSVRL